MSSPLVAMPSPHVLLQSVGLAAALAVYVLVHLQASQFRRLARRVGR